VECDVSLPQKANLVCKAKRFMEVLTMKDKWKLKVSPYGFALLDVPSPWTLVGRDFVNPFTRFYLEGYLQTVLTTDLSLIVYKGLVNNITDKEISHNYNYRILSKFFEMSAKLGGVRLNFCLFVCLYVCLLVCVRLRLCQTTTTLPSCNLMNKIYTTAVINVTLGKLYTYSV